jgi:hypothetical protein
MDETPSPLKSYANMTKKGFAILLDYVRTHMDPPVVDIAVNVVTEGLKVAIGFDASTQRSNQECKQMYEERRQRAEKVGMTAYELNNKKRYERLKKEYPDVPTAVLTKSKKDIEEYVKTRQK